MELRRYRSRDCRIPYSEWIAGLDDRTAARVSAYVDRMKGGNLGFSKPVGDGVLELKIDFGPGYRVYYIRAGQMVVILLCGGDKSSQDEDIKTARNLAADYRSRI